MKKYLTLILITIALYIFDLSIAPFLAVKGYFPSLLFLFILSYSIINGTASSLWLCIFAGVLQDVYFVNAFGLNAFANIIICVIAGIIGNNIFKEKSLIPVISSFFMSALKEIILVALLFIIGKQCNYSSILYTSIYNFILSFFIYRWVYKLCSKKYMKKQWKL